MVRAGRVPSPRRFVALALLGNLACGQAQLSLVWPSDLEGPALVLIQGDATRLEAVEAVESAQLELVLEPGGHASIEVAVMPWSASLVVAPGPVSLPARGAPATTATAFAEILPSEVRRVDLADGGVREPWHDAPPSRVFADLPIEPPPCEPPEVEVLPVNDRGEGVYSGAWLPEREEVVFDQGLDLGVIRRGGRPEVLGVLPEVSPDPFQSRSISSLVEADGALYLVRASGTLHRGVRVGQTVETTTLAADPRLTFVRIMRRRHVDGELELLMLSKAGELTAFRGGQLRDLARVQPPPGMDDTKMDLALRPDGELLVVSAGESDALFVGSDGRVERVPIPGASGATAATWDPARGAYLLVGGARGSELFVGDASGISSLGARDLNLEALSMYADGSEVFVAGRGFVERLYDTRCEQILVPQVGEIRALLPMGERELLVLATKARRTAIVNLAFLRF